MQQHDIPDCINLIDLSFGKNIHNESDSFENKEKNTPPWSWYGIEDINFNVFKLSDAIVGYVVWRKKPKISHLHSFLISADYQRFGLGTKMLNEYQNTSIAHIPDLGLFTLHTYESTEYNHKFYANAGYSRYQFGDEERFPLLNDWIENCREHGDWPLTHNKVLFYKSQL